MQRYFTNVRFCFLGALALLMFAAPVHAQMPAPPEPTGRIVGRVVDAQTGSGLSAVTVQVVGTQRGTLTGVDGRYAITQVPSGAATVRVSSIGYGTKTVTAVAVPSGAAVEQNISIETEAVEIAAIEVTAAAERGSVNRALDQQRTATGIVNAVTSEQITKSPDSDAAQAIQRVSGVTVQEGKFVVVRGLGERYTTTSLNGARIPSAEPEKKLVPFDMFPSSLLESITTSKTFTPDQSGDFSGAQVDIKMREFPVNRTRTLSTTFGWNGDATARSVFIAPTAGGEWMGIAGSARNVPQAVRDAGRFDGQISKDQMNLFVNSFRNAWSAKSGNGTPTGSLGGSIGGNDPIFGQRIGYVLSGTYSHGQEIRTNEVRASAQSSTVGGVEEVDRYTGTTGRTSVLWGGLLNASTLIGSRTRLALNTTYNRSADNEARHEAGFSEQFSLPLDVTRLRYIERAVASAQVLGEHEFGDRQRLNWAATGSRVTRREPDRSEFVYSTPSDPVTGQPLDREWFASAAEGAVRTFGNLNESAVELKSDYRMKLGRENHVKVGGLYRTTSRANETNAYSITAPTLTVTNRRLPAEQIFDGRFSQPGQTFFNVQPLAQGGSYTADDRLLAGYGMVEIGFTSKVQAIAGARLERSEMDVISTPTLGAPDRAQPSYTDVLPSLAVNIAVTENQNVRLSASQTLSRPEYRELAKVCYRDVIGAENICGNPNLVRALVRNFDARWELYPSGGEVLSVALFGKTFENPIERVYLATSGTRVVTFLNAAGATNYGVELEARKRFGFLADRLTNLTGFMNVTVMQSEIDIGLGGNQTSNLNAKRPMVGQSPYVLNTGLTYSNESGSASATALYNVFGKRIVSAGEKPLPDVYEQSRNQLDLSMRFALVGSLAGKVDLKNLLDSPYEVTQGAALREYYRAGRIVSVGMSWRP